MKYIWTKHAIRRLNERKISNDLIIQTINNPDRIEPTGEGAMELKRKINNRTIAAIIKEKENGEKIILSVWINPPYPGTRDFTKRARYFQMQNSGILKKFWLTFLNQIGL